jgi:hypothetical protein
VEEEDAWQGVVPGVEVGEDEAQGGGEEDGDGVAVDKVEEAEEEGVED